jgi:hypothetical protein
MALRKIAYRGLLPQRLQRDLRLQRRVNLPSRLRHQPLRPGRFGADFFQLSHWSQNPGPLHVYERLWRSLKYEDVYLKGYADGREAKTGISDWIAFYNERRLHQALGYRPPDQWEDSDFAAY